jgi:hypothetical protein
LYTVGCPAELADEMLVGTALVVALYQPQYASRALLIFVCTLLADVAAPEGWNMIALEVIPPYCVKLSPTPVIITDATYHWSGVKVKLEAIL